VSLCYDYYLSWQRKEEQTLANTYGLPEDIMFFGKEDVTAAGNNETAMNKTTKGP